MRSRTATWATDRVARADRVASRWTHVAAAGALGIVAAVCVALITYEVTRHRDGRALIRARRGALSTDDIARFEGERPQTRGISGHELLAEATVDAGDVESSSDGARGVGDRDA